MQKQQAFTAAHRDCQVCSIGKQAGEALTSASSIASVKNVRPQWPGRSLLPGANSGSSGASVRCLRLCWTRQKALRVTCCLLMPCRMADARAPAQLSSMESEPSNDHAEAYLAQVGGQKGQITSCTAPDADQSCVPTPA